MRREYAGSAHHRAIHLRQRPKKLAQALVEGRPIRIEGGDYQLCDGSGGVCGCSACHKHHLHCQREASTIAIHPCDNLEEDLQ